MIRVREHEYTLDDARAAVGELGDFWRELTTGRDASVATAAAWQAADVMAVALGDVVSGGDVGTELDRLSGRARHAIGAGSAEALVSAALTGMEAMVDAMRSAGEVAVVGTGTVAQISRSGGGVPKLPVEVADVGFRGIVGDVQQTRRHHGRPFQALCLWSTEVIDAFAAAGHPIGYGAAGENITISGLHWPDVGPGVRMRIGAALAEMSFFATPCTQNSRWFLGGDHTLMHADRGPVSRIYAWVREPGRIAVGDPVELVP